MKRRMAGRFLLPLLGLSVVSAWAQDPDPVASYVCDSKGGTLLIRYAPEYRQVEPAWPAQDRVVHFMSLFKIDEAQRAVEDAWPHVFSCQLKSERLDVTLEAGFPNPNLQGRCGAAITGLVTVKRNGTTVLDEREFENLNCHERERFVSEIIVREGSSEPTISYGAYRE